MKHKTIEFYLECYDEYVYVTTSQKKSRKAYEVMEKAYRRWILNIGNLYEHITCREYICQELDENRIKYTIKYGKGLRIYEDESKTQMMQQYSARTRMVKLTFTDWKKIHIH